MTRIDVLCGYSLIELTIVVGLIATLSAITAPPLLTNLDDFRTAGAARHLSARLQAARMEAVLRSADVAFLSTWAHGAVIVRSSRGGLVVETFTTKQRIVVRR